MKILILGGHGFVGKNVEEKFSKSGNFIQSLSRKDGLDLTDPDLTRNFLKDIKPDVIINLSANVGSLNYVARNAADVFDSNLNMLLNLYKGVKELIPKTVIINPVANCSYPGNLDFYSEDKYWDGAVHDSVLSFGSTRRMMIVTSECYKIQYGIRSVNYLVPNLYGPFDSTDPDKAHALNALISKVVKAKRENKNEIEVWGTGIAIREWLYAKDLAMVFLDTIRDIDSYLNNKPFNIGQNFGLSIRELVEIIVKETNFQGKTVWNGSKPDGAPKKVMDDKKFREIFPDFKFTNFQDGILETIKYYESVYPY